MADFSLIILCERRRHLLGATLDTLRSQKGSFEVLLIERGPLSSDLLASYPELKIQMERVDGNLAKMMNFGLKAAKGTYVQFLEPGDRYISQHGVSFLTELLPQDAHCISGGDRFFWLNREKVLESGGFNEKLRFCAMQDLLYRFELKGVKTLPCPRVVVDSPYEMRGSVKENCQILYRHFGLKRAFHWLFVENRPRAIERAARFLKQSFWQSE